MYICMGVSCMYCLLECWLLRLIDLFIGLSTQTLKLSVSRSKDMIHHVHLIKDDMYRFKVLTCEGG